MTLALIAGSGRLPSLLLERLDRGRVPCTLCRPDGMGVPPFDRPHRSFRIETLGTLLGGLIADGVTEVCIAGGVTRPPFDPARVDAATAPLVGRMATALGQGDDAALRVLLDIVEDAGLTIRAAHDLRPDLVPDVGVLGRVKPGSLAVADIDRGRAVVAALGEVDVGQACVVSGGQVLAIEAAPGTDAMLLALADWRARADRPSGGVLIKAPKPGQDHRVDLPAIGPDTVATARRAGLDGIALAAGGTMILDAEATVTAADDAGLWLWVR